MRRGLFDRGPRAIPAASGAIVLAALFGAAAVAQTLSIPSARLNVLLAENRRAPTSRDLTLLRTSVRNRDPETARLAIRALGRLERPSTIPDLLPALRFALPETRAEAADAIGQAAQGWAAEASGPGRQAAGAATPDSVLAALADRLDLEEDPGVRAVLCETIGRIPYRSREQVARAEAALVDHAARAVTVTDRLGIAKALEALARQTRRTSAPAARIIALARWLLGLPAGLAEPEAVMRTGAGGRLPELKPPPLHIDPLRDARLRRLALEALITLDAVDDEVVARTARDADAQVRRLAMRAAGASGHGLLLAEDGLDDLSPMVRIEALRAISVRGAERACRAALEAADDLEPHVALLALDQLAGCGAVPGTGPVLARVAATVVDAAGPRRWHRPAHAIVALAAAAPERAAPALLPFTAAGVWQLRMYGARAAAVLRDRAALDAFARDPHANVVEAAIEGQVEVAGHDADAAYVAALSRDSYAVIRAAARALAGTPDRSVAEAALMAAWDRLDREGRANSLDARRAIAATLERLGAAVPEIGVHEPVPPGTLTAENVGRLAAPRARIRVQGVGSFDLVLFTSEAPATVVRFVELAESGYYDGLTFHRVVPNFVVQGGSPAANEYAGQADHMRDEVGRWPNVRGTMGISSRGRDTGDAQIFINLVDNPRLDHEYTVFAQILNGIEVVDQILEGDVIESVEIVP